MDNDRQIQAISRRLYRTHSSASLPWLDSLANRRFMVQKYPMWKPIERSKFIDASLFSKSLFEKYICRVRTAIKRANSECDRDLEGV